jgi:hypothetical protein
MLIAVRFPRALLSALLLSVVCHPTCNTQEVESFKFFNDNLGLKDDQIAPIRNEKPIVRAIESRTPRLIHIAANCGLL